MIVSINRDIKYYNNNNNNNKNTVTFGMTLL